MLILACGVDGAGKTFPFAWRVVPFREQQCGSLRCSDEGLKDSQPVFFMSDQGPGLIKARDDVWTGSHPLLCLAPITDYKVNISRNVATPFWELARCADPLLDIVRKKGVTNTCSDPTGK
eukprot:gnl/Dysnectes_brevis/2489_a2977_1575.p1 GENE.gnl/Dysnectes_brevis/2489_a2977_1575~~gnl/Dysnectes_brevis/2489_a2977_1575.p1  ORF type:complete len:120 (+),score=6.88 gnl/Dysnectes_brevis/2489_a2977_1575:841-1200(+)